MRASAGAMPAASRTGSVSPPGGEDGLLHEFETAGNAGRASRAFLDSVRAELLQRHLSGASGSEIVHDFTAAMDDLVRALYRFADAEHRRRMPKLNQSVAVVARGGYGRRELNPYSDVDLLFVHDYKHGPYVEVVTELMLHALWDAGLTVGYAVRTVRHCVKMANSDLKEKTAILDARMLAGDKRIYATLEKAMVAEVLSRNQPAFFKAKLEESRSRHIRYGDSIYLLEPEIKEGEGGLRDLHTALWLARVRYRAGSLEELVHKAIISEAEFSEVNEARDFLWRLRNALHFSTGRHSDRLTFELQERIAPALGFHDRGGQSAGAVLMRVYYRHASVIHRFAEGLIARVIEAVSPRRYLGRNPTRRIRAGVLIHRDLLATTRHDFFRREPLNLITVYLDSQAHGVELSGRTYQQVRDNLGLINGKLRADARVGAALMEILSGRRRVAETLEAMHRSGVLGAIIPEFGNLYARVLHDLYHIYTVDRHSLAAVAELERLRGGDFKESAPLLTSVARELDFLPLIFLALLLHDIGKGHGHDHHRRGAALAARVAGRLGLGREEVELVTFLVRNHLRMSELSHKADIEDRATAVDFAREVGTINRLKALYLMTFADMRAVAPNVYNNWRDMLLSDLYVQTLLVLEQGDREAIDPSRRAAEARREIARQLVESGAPVSEVEEFVAQMPERYFLTVPGAAMGAHFELIRALRARPVVCRHRHFPDLEYSEFVVATHDQPGLFSKIAGVLTANNLNILSARITTSRRAVALDIFRLSHFDGASALAMEEDRWLKVERDLERVLGGRIEITDLVARAPHVRMALGGPFRRVPTEVTVDNRTSERFTLVDVFTQDRVGLLFTITHTLFELGVVIHLARVSTNADQALDVFHVTDTEGKKITELSRLRELRAALLAKLTPGGEEEAGH